MASACRGLGLGLGAIGFAVACGAAWCGRAAGGAPIEGRFEERFERARLGHDWLDTSDGAYGIVDGKLRVAGARNHPLWLRRRLPRDVRIELTARSESAAGDIKLEVFGDGRSFATADSYTATSYVLIFGGWNNRMTVLARMNEHGDDRLERTTPRVERGRTYRLAIERRGRRLTWWIDGQKVHELDDAAPLAGEGHDHFGFNDWDAELWFDDLVVTPLARR